MKDIVPETLEEALKLIGKQKQELQVMLAITGFLTIFGCSVVVRSLRWKNVG